MRDNVRKNDERNPRPERGSGEKGSQNRAYDDWVAHFGTFQRIAEMRDFENYDVSNLDIIREIAEALHEKLNMSAISPALPNSEQLDKLNEVENRLKRYPHLERCYFASDATIAELRKFYSEIARLQNEDEDIESAFERGITSLKKTIKALRSLERLGLHSKRALVIMGIQPDSSLPSELSEMDFSHFSDKQREKFLRIGGRIHKSSLEAYKTISSVTKMSWHYLPIEVQNVLESLARRALLHIPSLEELEQELIHDCLVDQLDELINTYKALALTVFAAVENGKGKPKLYLLELFESWDFNRCGSEQKLTKSLVMTEIQELTHDLAELSGVVKVEAVIRTPGDLHRIVFQIQVSEDIDEDSSFDSTEDLWEVATRMAFRSHKRLRESTSEKWYFDVVLNEDFNSDYPNSNRVVAVAHAESSNPY
jgi:hypothetical protein